ncbi:MAG: hypothetical protein WCR04_03265, partial [Fibrobacteraceae bacterium]
KWRKAFKPRIAGSERVRYHDLSCRRGCRRHQYREYVRFRVTPAAVIQPSKLGCATLTLRGIDALRHRLHFGHAQASLSATLNLDDVIVRSCISAIKTSKLVFAALDLHAVDLTKAVFRGALEIESPHCCGLL